MGKIYVRERQNIGKGAGRPRFAVVAVEGIDLKVYHTHIRRAELEKLAESTGAEIVYLPRGAQEQEQEQDQERGGGRRRRHGRPSNQE
jgi:hypothetical protein